MPSKIALAVALVLFFCALGALAGVWYWGP